MSPLTEWNRLLVTLQVLPCSMDLMSQPSVTGKVLTKLCKGLTTAKTLQSEVNDRAETYQANGSRLCCLFSPDDVHRLAVILSSTVYEAEGPCLSIWMAQSSLAFFRYETHVFFLSANWTCSPTLWIPISCSCSLDQIWREAPERKTHTHKHMCLEEVGCGGTDEVSHADVRALILFLHVTWNQNNPIYFSNAFLVLLCMKKRKQMWCLNKRNNF